jgi:hypothetical protein
MRRRVAALIEDMPAFPGLVELRREGQALWAKYRETLDGGDSESPAERLPSTFSRSQLRSCQICAQIDEQTWRFLARYQYKLATDHEAQADLARRSGFCCYHAWEHQGVASPVGASSGYPQLLERMAAALSAIGASSVSDPRSAIDVLLPTHEKCVVCAVRDEAEALAIGAASKRLREDVTTALDELSALCLPHLAALAAVVDDPETIRALANLLASTHERVAEDMRRFTLKQSAARRQLHTEEEEAAAKRGLLLLAGRRNANFAVGHAPRSAQLRPSQLRPR